MSSPNVIDFAVARLRALNRVTPEVYYSQHLDPSDFPDRHGDVAGSDDAALVVRLVLQLSRLNGRNYEGLPQVVRTALEDLCAEGDATCRLVRSWLLGESVVERPAAKPRASAKHGDRIFRHNRFWSPNSPYLRKADDRRRTKLIVLLAELEGGA